MTKPSPTMPEAERLSRWVRDHGRALHGFLAGLVRDRHAAEDLLQEVFCRAWLARERYQESGQERAYLLRIADRLACDRLRRLGREVAVDDKQWAEIEPADKLDLPLDTLARWECRRELDAALRELSEPQRRTLLLRYYGDLEFSEIAQMMNCPVNTALSHARRGLLTLRRLLVEKPI
jgi:RNA polymerase sigma-70 factor (ECF subfamily)